MNKIKEKLGETIEILEEKEIADSLDRQIAVDTRGEVTFLQDFAEQNNSEKNLSISRLTHTERIETLIKANEVQAYSISAEGILAYFHPVAVDRFLTMFSEVVESNQNFTNAEKKKMLLMLIDKKGRLLETIARFAGDLKPKLMDMIGQDKI